MTKERRLAEQMWREIADGIRKGTLCNMDEVDTYKADFCMGHNLNWESWCYLCEYWDRDCKTCPLGKRYGSCTTRWLQDSGQPFVELVNRFDDYKEEDRESLADMAGIIADVIGGKSWTRK